MSVVENFVKFYSKKENKERLFKLIKTSGIFQRLSEVDGYIYTVKIGVVEGEDVMLDVALKKGNLTIKNIRKGELTLSTEGLQQASNQ